MQLTVDDACVVACRNPSCIDRVGLPHEVAKLRESVAANARNRRAASGVLAYKVVDHILAESRLEVDHVVRYAKLLADATCVIH